MMNRMCITGLAIFTAALSLSACGSTPTSSNKTQTAAPTAITQPTKSAAITGPSGNNPTPTNNVRPTATELLLATLPSVSNGETGGETGGVEAALVTYSDAAQGFAIGYPGPWTQDKSVTQGVKFVGGDSSLTLEFVTPSAGLDAMTYAQNDVATVAAAFPGFKQLSLAASTEVKNAIILGYEATGTSAVTGKAYMAHDERYYMPLADGRIAILTVTGPDNHYDREGVRDIALTFKVTK
jgi:hypothetical protein